MGKIFNPLPLCYDIPYHLKEIEELNLSPFALKRVVLTSGVRMHFHISLDLLKSCYSLQYLHNCLLLKQMFEKRIS